MRILLVLLMLAAAPAGAQGIDFLDANGFEDGCDVDTDSDRLPNCVENGTNRYISPALTTARQDLEAIGHAAIDCLTRPATAERYQRCFPARLVVRESA